jgi:hypothetical protein
MMQKIPEIVTLFKYNVNWKWTTGIFHFPKYYNA